MPPFTSLVYPHGLVDNRVLTLFHGALDDFSKYDVPPRDYSRLSPSSRMPYYPPEGRDLQWIHCFMPYLALIPSNNPFRGSLFRRLHFHGGHVPIVRDERGWSLDPELISDWRSLEFACRNAILAMMDIDSNILPPRFQLFYFPEQFRYDASFRHWRAAVTAARISQNAFLPLMGALSLMVLALPYQVERQQIGDDWRERLARASGVHQSWLARLEDSILCDLEEPRLGGVIHMQDWESTNLFPLFRRFNMPIFFSWGRLSSPPQYPRLEQRLVPTMSIIDHLHRADARERMQTIHAEAAAPLQSWTAASNLRSWNVSPSPTPHLSPPSSNPLPASTSDNHPLPFPPVERYSGQRPGESMDEFFQRRAEGNNRIRLRETPQQRQSREAKETHAESHECPGRQGARVYLWETVDGHRIRKAAGRPLYERYWELYGPSQRRYDGFAGEWDICTEFDPNDERMHCGICDDEDEDHDHDDNNISIEDEEPLPRYTPPPDIDEEFDIVDDLHRELDDVIPPAPSLPDIPHDLLEDVAYYRFGFQDSSDALAGDLGPTLLLVRQLLGDGWSTSQQPSPSEATSTLMRRFFELLAASTTPADIPESMYDIRDPKSHINCLPSSLGMMVRIIHGDPVIYVFIPLHVAQNPFFVVVKSAATVVEIFRRNWDKDLTLLIGELLKRCVPFQLCIAGPRRASRIPQPISLVPSLGYRNARSTFDAVDFLAYENLRDAFLRSPRGHLALFAGGIIARLARHVIVEDRIYDGPTVDVMISGMFIPDVESDRGYYSDVLSEAEVDLILGVYRVEAGTWNTYPQTRRLSWWPRRFETSALWAGYWTADCEKWFTSQLAKYRGPGEKTLRTTQGWKDSLKFSARVRKIFNRNEIVMGNWLKESPRQLCDR